MQLFTLCLFTLATGVTSLNLCQRLRYRVWGLNMLNAWGIVCNIGNGIITKVYINTDKNIQEYNVRYHQVCLTYMNAYCVSFMNINLNWLQKKVLKIWEWKSIKHYRLEIPYKSVKMLSLYMSLSRPTVLSISV